MRLLKETLPVSPITAYCSLSALLAPPSTAFVEPETRDIERKFGERVLVLRRNCRSLNAPSKEAQGDPDRREAAVLAPACHWS